MDLSKNILILSLSFFLFSCGGGGGGSSASPVAASPVAPTYSYDKTSADYSSKNWDIKSQMRRSEQGRTTGYSGFGDYPLTISLVESSTGSNYFDISISGNTNGSSDTSMNYNFQLSEQATEIVELYNPDNLNVATLFGEQFSNATLYGVAWNPAYLETVGVSHTNIGFFDFAFSSGRRDTFAFNYGSKTQSGDMPTSGSATYAIGAFLLLHGRDASRGYGYDQINFISEGTGSLNVNFSSMVIDGKVDLTKWYLYSDFLSGAGASSQTQILGFPATELVFAEGSISSNNYSGGIIFSGGGAYGTGAFQGSFFGPSASETSGTFIIGRSSDEDNSGIDYWDIVGGYFGCRSGC